MATETIGQIVPQHTDSSIDVHHGVHVECQQGAPFVVSVCGLAMGWEERGGGNGKPFCEKCDGKRKCPVCGIRLAGWAD